MRTLQVFYPDSTTGVLISGFPGGHPASIDGSMTLMQDIVLYLKTRPGSDSFDPTRGSILGDPGALSKALRDPGQLKVLVTGDVSNCQSYIIAQQEDQRQAGVKLSTNETLVQLEVNNVYQGADPTSIFVEILVHTAGNQQFTVTV